MSRELTEVEADSLHTELKEAVATFFGGSCSHSSSFEVRILKSLKYQVKPIRSNLLLSFQTEKLVAGPKFSDYLSLKHYKKAKK